MAETNSLLDRVGKSSLSHDIPWLLVLNSARNSQIFEYSL